MMMMTTIKITNDLNFLPLLSIGSSVSFPPLMADPFALYNRHPIRIHITVIVTWLKKCKQLLIYSIILSCSAMHEPHLPETTDINREQKKKEWKEKWKIICINLISLSCLFTCLLYLREHTRERRQKWCAVDSFAARYNFTDD